MLIKPLRIIKSTKHPGAIFLKNRITNKFLLKIYPADSENRTEQIAKQIQDCFSKKNKKESKQIQNGNRK